jgi:hypothetical protein
MKNFNALSALSVPLALTTALAAPAMSSHIEYSPVAHEVAESGHATRLSHVKIVKKQRPEDLLRNEGESVTIRSLSNGHKIGTIDHDQKFRIDCEENAKVPELEVTSGGEKGEVLVTTHVENAYAHDKYGVACVIAEPI